MGLGTGVVGFRPPDDTWRRMKAVWDACNNAGVEPPSEVDDFFEGMAPDEAGVEVQLDTGDNPAAAKYETEFEQGWQVDVTKLPANVTVIRFSASW